MAKPILNPPRVMAGVRECVAAALAQHVAMHPERKAGALANALHKPVQRATRTPCVVSPENCPVPDEVVIRERRGAVLALWTIVDEINARLAGGALG